MNPKSFSATALQVAEACTARYKAEMVDRVKGMSGGAATLGSSVHGALEMYVKAVHLDKTASDGLPFLLDLFRMSYMTEYGTSDTDTVEYMEGRKMLEDWHARTDFSTRTVLSVETKSQFMVKTSVGEIPFNYIWDRFDYLGDGEYEVVDYKTNRWGIRPEDLRKKLQARAYSMAAAMQLKREGKEVKRIWVSFDMLRHDGPVGISFSRDENVATYKFINELAQRIVDTPESEVKETINNECVFCVRKQGCKALTDNIMVGGIHSITSIEDAIDLRAQYELQTKAIKAAATELDARIIAEARGREETTFESDQFVLNIGMSSTRAVDADMAEKAIGPQLFSKYGGRSLSMATVDKLLKGTELTPQQKSSLRSLIYNKRGEPRVKIEAKSIIDED